MCVKHSSKWIISRSSLVLLVVPETSSQFPLFFAEHVALEKRSATGPFAADGHPNPSITTPIIPICRGGSFS